MANWREQKREARRIVHDTMAIADIQYYAEDGATPVPARARLHYSFNAIGDDRSMGWAEQQAVKPRLIFMRDEITPKNLAIVYFQPGEAYRIDNVLPPDDITVTVEVTRMSARQYEQAGLPPVGDAP